jgi:RNA recognition motif-containing protein
MSSYSSTKKPGRRAYSRRRFPSRSKEKNREDSYSEETKPSSLWMKILSFFRGISKPPKSRSSKTTRSKYSSSDRSEIRKPELVEVTSPRLYVGNLSFDATESDLFELFRGVGSVQNVEIVCHRQTHRSKGFAFVQMQAVEEARRAVSELHDKEYMGRKLVVSGAKALEERRAE